MALNIFSGETIYGGWQKVGENISLKDATAPEFFNAIDEEAVVTESSQGYGKSVCFFLHNGQNRVYKQLSSTCGLQTGTKVNKNDLYVTVLAKVGEENIYRITNEK